MPLKQIAKRIASKLPRAIQNELKRLQFALQITRNKFYTDEAEYTHLEEWVSDGDWVLDIGANIGHYTMKLSKIVGAAGRVIAFEPVPATFELLAANVAKSPFNNVTSINAAASDQTGIVNINIPTFNTGLENYYMAHISENGSGLQCMTLAVDSLNLVEKVRLIKIDAEGHELSVLRGMTALITRCHPVMIIEDSGSEIQAFLENFGYCGNRIPGSSNQVYQIDNSVSTIVDPLQGS